MSEGEVERLRKQAHDAPMAPIYTDHKGRKSIGIHTDAWWKSSREYAAAKDLLSALALTGATS